jgi:exodeoxyribonuclease V alpha subunit
MLIDLEPIFESLSKRNLALVTGGPGSGKTTLAARLVARSALDFLLKNSTLPTIALAAPTGKAAARLSEAFAEALPGLAAELALPQNLLAALQEVQASTLHRLLGFSKATDGFTYHADTPLQLDILLIDECSMIATQLMHALMQALDTLGQRAPCKLILLGDAKQLEAVESGTPFAEMLAAARGAESPLFGCALSLKTQWRANSELAELTGAVRDLDEAESSDDAILQVMALLAPKCQEPNESRSIKRLMIDAIQRGLFDGIFKASSLTEAWAAVDQCRVLCALHQGPAGQIELNEVIDAALRARFNLNRLRYPEHFPGQLLMAVRNDYQLGVMNGDVGLVWPDAVGQLKVYFEREDQLEGMSLWRVSGLKSAFAMTVHKAQGSEFDRVIFVLPEQGAEPLLHRALIYTAITRAKSELEGITTLSVLESALQQTVQRRSGLLDRLLAPKS